LRPPWGKKLDCFEKGKAKREGELSERNLISEIRGGGGNSISLENIHPSL